MSAARLNSRALTVRGTLPQIGSFSLAERSNPHPVATAIEIARMPRAWPWGRFAPRGR